MGYVLNMKDEDEVKVKIEIEIELANLGNEYNEEFIKQEHKTVQRCAECECGCHGVDELKPHQITGQGGQQTILKCQKCNGAFHSKMIIDYHHEFKAKVVMDLGVKDDLETEKDVFQCNICDKILARRDILAAHMKIHTGIRFNCTDCNSGYSREDKLVIHQKQKHSYTKKRIIEARLERSKPLSTMDCPAVPSKSPQVSQKKKDVSCKQCLQSFPDGVKLNEHMCPRRYTCDKCDSEFKVKDDFVKHRRNNHSTVGVMVRKKVGPRARVKKDHADAGTLELNDNHQDSGEFIIDALYLDRGQLNCRVRNMECFATGDVLEMKAHRDKYHLFLEQRISFDKWKHVITGRFLNKVEEMDLKEDRKSKDDIDITKIIQNVKKESAAPIIDDKKAVDPICKDFGDNLVNLKHRYAGR